MITNDSIQRLKETANIVDLISRFVEVSRSGANNMCVCPFHDDKNPSMAIYENEGYYHCFGCGEHGDVIKFLQKYKNLEFIEAVKELANIYNFSLEETNSPKRLNNALTTLNEYYVSELNVRGELIKYLENRKITRELRVKFSLGYAPSANDTLRVLQKSNIEPNTALEQGVVKRNEKGLYPSFIDRITFPIYDHTGFLVGFGGRTLNPNNPAKYVNSPASKLFDKKNIFYGFHLAKNDIYKYKKMIICEGYMDTISLHKAGFTYTVAVLGTALTHNHLKYIKKDCSVSLCFDKDAAGQNAAFKAGVILSQNGYNADVIKLKTYKDPGEYIENNEESKLAAELNETINVVYFCIEYIFKNELKLEYLDKLSLKAIDPFLIKNAYAKVLEYTNKIDKFISSAHLKIFCDKYGFDFNLLNGIKTTSVQKENKKSVNTNLENAILYFLANTKSDFRVLVIRRFFSNEVVDLILERDFSNPKIIEFLNEIHITCKINELLVFFNNIARFYASNNIKNAVLFKNYASMLEKNPKIAYCKEKLNKAYNILVDLIESDMRDLSSSKMLQIKKEIINLGV